MGATNCLIPIGAIKGPWLFGLYRRLYVPYKPVQGSLLPIQSSVTRFGFSAQLLQCLLGSRSPLNLKTFEHQNLLYMAWWEHMEHSFPERNHWSHIFRKTLEKNKTKAIYTVGFGIASLGSVLFKRLRISPTWIFYGKCR